jgi:hypothetical protein
MPPNIVRGVKPYRCDTVGQVDEHLRELAAKMPKIYEALSDPTHRAEVKAKYLCECDLLLEARTRLRLQGV